MYVCTCMNEKRSQKWTIAPHAFVCSDARVCIQKCGNNSRGGEGEGEWVSTEKVYALLSVSFAGQLSVLFT